VGGEWLSCRRCGTLTMCWCRSVLLEEGLDFANCGATTLLMLPELEEAVVELTCDVVVGVSGRVVERTELVLLLLLLLLMLFFVALITLAMAGAKGAEAAIDTRGRTVDPLLLLRGEARACG